MLSPPRRALDRYVVAGFPTAPPNGRRLLRQDFDRHSEGIVEVVFFINRFFSAAGANGAQGVSDRLLELLVVLIHSNANLPIRYDHERALELLRIIGHELIDQAKIDQKKVGAVIYDQPRASRNIWKGDNLDGLLSILHALIAELTKLRFFHGSEAGAGANAADVVKAHDMLWVALLHHSAGRRARIDDEVHLLSSFRAVVESIPHRVCLAVGYGGELSGPGSELEFNRNADAFECALGQFGIEPDELTEVLRIPHGVGRSFAVGADLDRLAYQARIFCRQLVRFAFRIRGDTGRREEERHRQQRRNDGQRTIFRHDAHLSLLPKPSTRRTAW